MTPVLLAVISVLAATACVGVAETAPGTEGVLATRTTGYTTAEFWDNYRKSSALEANPAQSLSDLYERSERIVLGPVIDAEAGPSYPVRLDDGSTDENGTTILTVRVDKVLSGPAESEVKVWIANTDRAANDAPADLMPSDSLIWYLRASEEHGIMYATARDGIVGNTGDGKLTTMLSGTIGEEFFPANITSVEQLAASIAGLGEPSAD